MSILFEQPWLGATLFLAATVAIGVLPFYILSRVYSDRADEHARTVAGSVITRIGVLHALIIALIFVQETDNYLGVTKSVVKEAGAIADVYYDLKRYDRTETLPIRKMLAAYVRINIDEEWPLLAKEKKLSGPAWGLYDAIDVALLQLRPANNTERTAVRRQLVEDWDSVSEYRRAREVAANRSVPLFFWILAVFGFFAVTVPYFVFPANRANTALLVLFALYNGIVFYLIAGIGNPFSGPAPIGTEVFERLYLEDMVRLLDKP
jgi:hypothetical protein